MQASFQSILQCPPTTLWPSILASTSSNLVIARIDVRNHRHTSTSQSSLIKARAVPDSSSNSIFTRSSRPNFVRPTNISAPLLTTYIKRCESLEKLQAIVDQHSSSFNHIHLSAALVHSITFRSGSETLRHQDILVLNHAGGTPLQSLQLQLLSLVPPLLEQFDIQGLCNTLYVMAKAGYHDVQLIESLLASMQYRMDLGLPQNVSNVLWACATLHYSPDRDWMALYYDAIDSCIKDFNPQDISNTLWAAAKLQEHDSRRLSDEATTSASGQQSLTGRGKLAKPLFRVPSSIIGKLAHQAFGQMAGFSSQQLSNTVWALAEVGYVVTPEWSGRYVAAAAIRLRAGEFSPRELNGMVSGMSRLHIIPSPVWLDYFLKVSYTKLPVMEPEDISQVLLSLGAMRIKPPMGWLMNFVVQATKNLQQFGPQELSNAMLGIARLWPQSMPGTNNDLSTSMQLWLNAVEAKFPLVNRGSTHQGAGELCNPCTEGATSMQEDGDCCSSSDGGREFASSSGRTILKDSPRSRLNTQEICNVMFAAAKLGLQPGAKWLQSSQNVLFPRMGELAAQPRQAAMTAWALSRLGDDENPSEAWLAAFESATEPKRLAAVTAMELSTLLTAFAGWSRRPSKRWLARFWWRSMALLSRGQLPPRHLAPMLAAMCTLRLRPHATWALVCCSSMTVEFSRGTFSAKQLSSACRSLALLGVKPSTRWVRVYLTACYRQWDHFGPQEWSEMMWGLVKMEVKPPQEWLSRLSSSTQLQLPDFNHQQQATLIWALSSLKHQPEPSWVDTFLSSSQDRLELMSDSQLANTLWHLNNMRAAPTREWVLALVQTTRKRNFEGHGRILMEKALAALISRVTYSKPPRQTQARDEEDSKVMATATSPR